jgi:hypothetical protein
VHLSPARGASGNSAVRVGRDRREQFRETEVGDQGLPPGAEQDVRRLEVAVDDVAPVGVVHRPGDLGHQGDRGRGVVAVAAEPEVQAPAGGQLHGEIRPPFVETGLVNGRDVPVPQPGEEPGLALEAAHGVRARRLRGEHLQGDRAVERPLPGPVDHANAADAEQAADVVSGHRGPGRHTGACGTAAVGGAHPEHRGQPLKQRDLPAQLAEAFRPVGAQLLRRDGLTGLLGALPPEEEVAQAGLVEHGSLAVAGAPHPG